MQEVTFPCNEIYNLSQRNISQEKDRRFQSRIKVRLKRISFSAGRSNKRISPIFFFVPLKYVHLLKIDHFLDP